MGVESHSQGQVKAVDVFVVRGAVLGLKPEINQLAKTHLLHDHLGDFQFYENRSILDRMGCLLQLFPPGRWQAYGRAVKEVFAFQNRLGIWVQSANVDFLRDHQK
ncbi:hypothetical protein DSCO28_53590 [Desulfosarcina ovata subsp. sediminis]|uniref:Uncharacterized protein n=1 Tax=Desulfosarcina ovata subsp. sediminis TaxID=885957 RepID=A0A5K7ZX11_9BACT|nr:hypothetical protein DSCO28_53590 [Desulfosarcina ovata subsp. sediminis]